ncbi:rCG42645 [Rattus norvegicus]|uniref:RCG42645 n=1 Tax=Rattus norvegicus TaxID=10116 RepID=A6K1N9_RAT|nr:rCG42645 [Rattus norvegicus]
MQRPGTGRMLE